MAVPFVTYTLDKPYELRFTIGVGIEFEKLTGLKLSEMDSDPSLEQYKLMLLLMIRRIEKDMTQEKLDEILDEYATSIGEIVDHVSVAYVAGTTGRDLSVDDFKNAKESLANPPNASSPTAKKKR